MPVSTLTLAAICDAIDTSLGEALVAAGALTKSHSYDELEEGINDRDVLQVYPEAESPVWCGAARLSFAVRVRRGKAWYVPAWYGMVRRGKVWLSFVVRAG